MSNEPELNPVRAAAALGVAEPVPAPAAPSHPGIEAALERARRHPLFPRYRRGVVPDAAENALRGPRLEFCRVATGSADEQAACQHAERVRAAEDMVYASLSTEHKEIQQCRS